MLYNAVLVSAAQQSEPAIHTYIYVSNLFFGFPSHLGHHRALSSIPCAAESSHSLAIYPVSFLKMLTNILFSPIYSK